MHTQNNTQFWYKLPHAYNLHHKNRRINLHCYTPQYSSLDSWAVQSHIEYSLSIVWLLTTGSIITILNV